MFNFMAPYSIYELRNYVYRREGGAIPGRPLFVHNVGLGRYGAT